MLLDDLFEPPGEAFVRLGLGFQHVAGKDHVILMRLQHVGHFLVRCGPDAGHGRLCLLVGLHADFVDAVGDVLLLGRLERLGERVIEHNALLGVGLQLVDEHHLGRSLVLQAVHPGLALLDIALERLALGELDLFVLHHGVVARIQIGQLGLELGSRRRVGFVGDLVFECNDVGVHGLNVAAQALQFAHGKLALVQCFGEVGLDLHFLLFQNGKLAFEQLGDHVGFGNQILQLVVDIGGAYAFLTHTVRLGRGKDAHEAFPARLAAHLVEILGKRSRDIIQPHDQLGDVFVHHLRVRMYVLERGVLDVEHRVLALGNLGACGFDAAGQFLYLCLCLGHLGL